MNQEAFLETVYTKAGELKMNPVLLLSGIEGLYTFRDVPLNTINYEFLDSLILTIFALRIGDEFHQYAQENLSSSSDPVRQAAAHELKHMTDAEIESSANPYIASFAKILNGKSPVRNLHQKALEAAMVEINNVQLNFHASSISTIMLGICNKYREELGIGELFQQS